MDLFDHLAFFISTFVEPVYSFLFGLLTDVVVPLGWPLVVGASVWSFRKEFSGLIRRLKKGPYGMEFYKQELTDHKSGVSALRGPDAQMSEFDVQDWDDPSLGPWRIVTETATSISQQRGDDGIVALTRLALAQALRKADFERAARYIYGTQIGVLKRLRETPEASREAADFTQLYELHQERSDGLSTLRFDVWIGFLVNYALVSHVDSSFQITAAGRLFLDFLFVERIDENRML